MGDSKAVPRRHFLRGAADATLLLPILPSLAPKGALAATQKQKRFVYFGTEHGGIPVQNMYPTMVAPKTQTILPNFDARYSPLQRKIDGANASLSAVLTAPTSALSDNIVSKMNVLRGIDLPIYFGHHEGAHLGNNARTDQGPRDLPNMVTIDQVMAYSPSFYSTTTGVRERAIQTGVEDNGKKLSWSYTDITNRTGVQAAPKRSNPGQIFDALFGTNVSTMPQPAKRATIVDRVLENYRSLRNSNRRLSALDKQRLDDHIARVAELQRRLTQTTPISCDALKRPTMNYDSPTLGSSFSQARDLFKDQIDVIVTALACGATSIAVIHVGHPFLDWSGDWHKQVAHKEMAGWEVPITAGGRNTFEHTFLYMANRLNDVKDAQGEPLLDNSLLMWAQESGRDTHDPQEIPVVTAGSAGGFLNTGMYCDYRNLSCYTPPRYDDQKVQFCVANRWENQHYVKPDYFAGLMYPQLLATALSAMGVPRSDWEPKQLNGLKGYGFYYRATDPICQTGGTCDAAKNGKGNSLFVPGVYENASDPLPIITKV